MEEYIARGEFNATITDLKNEDSRQNKRLGELEETIKKINELTISVNKLATNMENMLNEQRAQGKRLEALEARDGEMWRKVVSYAVTAAIGILIGFMFKQFGIV